MASIQLLDYTGQVLQDISNDKIISENLSFSNILGSGQASLTLDLKFKYSEINILGKFIKLFIGDRIVYTGIIQNIKYDFIEKITISVIGIYDLFNRVSFHTLVDYQGGVIRQILEALSSNYPGWIFTKEIDGGRVTGLDMSNKAMTGGELVKDFIGRSNYDFYLGADLIVYFKEQISTTIHKLSVGKEIISGYYGEDISQLQTDISYRNYTTSKQARKVNEDAEIEYGKIDKDNATSLNTSSELARAVQESYERYDIKRKTEVIITAKCYDIFSIKVGDFINITNTDIEIKNLKIMKIDFTLYTAKLYLDRYDNIVKNLK